MKKFSSLFKNRNTRHNTIFVILLLLTGLISNYYGKYRVNQIKSKTRFVIGKPVGLSGGGRNQSRYFDFSYNFRGVEYKTSALARGNWKMLNRNKTIPIAIDSTNPENSSALLYPSMFEAFGFSYPDSLTWVCVDLELENCKNKFNYW